MYTFFTIYPQHSSLDAACRFKKLWGGGVRELTVRDMTVVVGGHKITNRSEPTQIRHKVQWAVVHKLYKNFHYDIMLLQLQTSIRFDEKVAPICVDKTRFPPNTTCLVTGWGATTSNSRPKSFIYIMSRDISLLLRRLSSEAQGRLPQYIQA